MPSIEVVTLPSEDAQHLAYFLSDYKDEYLLDGFYGGIHVSTDLLAKVIQRYWDSLI